MQNPSVKLIRRVILFASSSIILLWSIHIISWITGYSFAHYGIYPREWHGMLGILTAPLVHADFQHLLSNSFPFFVLTGIIYFFYKSVAIPSFVLIYLLTGFTVWLFARPVYHIGASGVVYGLISFILFSGIFRRNIKSIVLALSVTVLYSGYFYGLVPLKDGVSWESHLFGALVGVLIAFIFKEIIEDDELTHDPFAGEQYESKQFYLPRDAFDKTLEQRKIDEQFRINQELQNENF